jgi:hypothetical protein
MEKSNAGAGVAVIEDLRALPGTAACATCCGAGASPASATTPSPT